MKIRKILGGVVNERTGGTHSVAKLDNGLYAVGDLVVGEIVNESSVFKTLTDTCVHWSVTLPFQHLPSRREVVLSVR